MPIMANGRCPKCNNLVLKGNVTQGSCEVECDRCKHHFVLKPVVTDEKKRKDGYFQTVKISTVTGLTHA